MLLLWSILGLLAVTSFVCIVFPLRVSLYWWLLLFSTVANSDNSFVFLNDGVAHGAVCL